MTITIFTLIVLLFSMIIHEIAHGSVALHLGDQTAKYAGRLTLNPLKHIDPFGSVLLPIALFIITLGRGPIFGWAIPVPINPLNFRDQKWGTLKVSIAGPAVNFLIAIIFGLFIRFLALPEIVFNLFGIICIYNFAWGIFNLVPIPPLDGSHIVFTFLGNRFSGFKLFLQRYGFFVLIFLLFSGFLNFVFLGARVLFYLVCGKPPII